MLARGQEAHSLRVQAKHNFCLIAKIGEMMNTKDKNSHCLKADIMERCFSDALEGNAAYTWLFLSKEKQAMSKLGSSGTSLVVQWVRLCTPNAGGPGFDPWSGN